MPGKTYKQLINIKKQYSTALQKLLIFPGDCHILKNYQPILMKVYYVAGLKEIARNSGYHGSTLKSVEQSSNYNSNYYIILVYIHIQSLCNSNTLKQQNSTNLSYESTHLHTNSIRTTYKPFYFYRIRFCALLYLYLQRSKIGSG